MRTVNDEDKARARFAQAVATLGPDHTFAQAMDLALRKAKPAEAAWLAERREEIREEIEREPIGWSVEMTWGPSDHEKPIASAGLLLHPSANFLPIEVVGPILLTTAVLVSQVGAMEDTLPAAGLGDPKHLAMLPPAPWPVVHWRSMRSRFDDIGGGREVDVLTACADMCFLGFVHLVGDRDAAHQLLGALWNALREGDVQPSIGMSAGRYYATPFQPGPGGAA